MKPLRRIRDHLRRNAYGLVALFIVLGGGAYAAAKIGPNDIAKNAVRSKHIKNGQVKKADLGAGAVTVDDQRPVADVADRGTEPEHVRRVRAGAGLRDDEVARRLLDEVRQPRRRGVGRRRAARENKGRGGNTQGDQDRHQPPCDDALHCFASARAHGGRG
jgi:hypothetical protein